MSYLSKEAILLRLRSGVTSITDGEVKAVLNHLLEKVDELTKQVEDLCRSCPAGESPEKDTSDGVCGGRKSKQDEGKAGSSPGNA